MARTYITGPQSSVPVLPGPWAFLASLGEVGAQALEAKEADRQKKLKEAQDRLNQMITLRTAGLIKPDSFGSPEAMQLYKTLGIMPVTDQPTPAERVNDIRGRFLSPEQSINIPMPSLGIEATGQPMQPSAPMTKYTAGPRSVTPTERVVAGLPSQSAIEAENAKNEAAKDAYYTSMTSRAADAAIARAGGDLLRIGSAGLPQTMDVAWRIAEQDAKSKGFVLDEQITRPYVEAEFAARWREAQRAETERLRATNTGPDPNAGFLRLLSQQQQAITQQLNALQKPDMLKEAMAQTYAVALQKAGNDPAAMQQLQTDPKLAAGRNAYMEVLLYKTTVERLNNEMATIRNQTLTGLGQQLPSGTTGPGASQAGRMMSDQQVAAAAAIIRSGQGTIEQFTARVKNGQASPTDLAAVISQLTTGVGTVMQGGQK